MRLRKMDGWSGANLPRTVGRGAVDRTCDWCITRSPAVPITGFDQAPDFIIPDELNPVALIEAKLTEDDGRPATRSRVCSGSRTLRES